MLQTQGQTTMRSGGSNPWSRTSCRNRSFRSRKEESRCWLRVTWNGCVSFGSCAQNDTSKQFAESENFLPKAMTSSSPETLSNAVEDQTEDKFNWFKNWWAVQVVDNLETDRPNKIQLLNRDFIVWKGHSGEWIAMNDECPHRMAPLSEGRIEEDGNLLCSYHAWRFNESGKCVKIPHAEDEKAHSVACNSPRSAVQTYPCKTRGSLLWIWPDDSESAFFDSSLEPFPIDDDFADYFEEHTGGSAYAPYLRILPYSFDTLMENVADPSHLTVAHHGVGPRLSRYSATSMNMKRVQPIRNKNAVEAVTYRNPPLSDLDRAEFIPPGVVISYPEAIGKKFDGRTFITVSPVTHGKSRIIIAIARESLIVNPKDPSIFMRPLNAVFNVLIHVMLQSRVFDSDARILHGQDIKLKKQGSQFIAGRDYFMATDADTLVSVFRRWFETVGERGAAFGGDQPLDTTLPREEVINRYEQHTKHCQTCLKALEFLRSAVLVCRVLFAFSSFLVCGLLLRSIDAGHVSVLSIVKNVKLMALLLLSMLFASAFYFLEKKIIPLFYFVDHSHADMN